MVPPYDLGKGIAIEFYNLISTCKVLQASHQMLFKISQLLPGIGTHLCNLVSSWGEVSALPAADAIHNSAFYIPLDKHYCWGIGVTWQLYILGIKPQIF